MPRKGWLKSKSKKETVRLAQATMGQTVGQKKKHGIEARCR
jgi:hypothetical protein